MKEIDSTEMPITLNIILKNLIFKIWEEDTQKEETTALDISKSECNDETCCNRLATREETA